mmetsp:Transcript_7871/g.18413  ORF Transcript_7871/g.18413 Transcript_7871/m.18413 type:complete len:240 (+) Transcript_7871:410-1129(+)
MCERMPFLASPPGGCRALLLLLAAATTLGAAGAAVALRLGAPLLVLPRQLQLHLPLLNVFFVLLFAAPAARLRYSSGRSVLRGHRLATAPLAVAIGATPQLPRRRNGGSGELGSRADFGEPVPGAQPLQTVERLGQVGVRALALGERLKGGGGAPLVCLLLSLERALQLEHRALELSEQRRHAPPHYLRIRAEPISRRRVRGGGGVVGGPLAAAPKTGAGALHRERRELEQALAVHVGT